MLLYWTKINKIIDESPEVKTFLLDLPEDLTWEEGAHVHMGLTGFNKDEKPNRGLVRHMSICTVPSEQSVGITTRLKEQSSEFKTILKSLSVGDEVALFKIHSNVPLKRVDKQLYLLSSGVGIATFRPVVLEYLQDQSHVKGVHSLNIDSAEDYLFTEIFTPAPEKNFTTDYVKTRPAYYAAVEKLAADQDGLFYVIGSDTFIKQNIELLTEKGIPREQIMLDKRKESIDELFSAVGVL